MSGLEPVRSSLVNWLVREAYPLWSRHGIDPAGGGFVEALDQNGLALAWARRARVCPRQVYAFCQARGLGWQGDVAGIVHRAMGDFVRHYRRADGLFLTLADANGSVQDARALLYDQAFVLLGYAAAALELDAIDHWENHALELRHRIDLHLRTDDGAYRSAAGADGHDSNPHMHLLEACIAWAEIGHDEGWIERVRSLVDVALSRFIRQDDGSIGEFYSSAWQRMPAISGNSIEPGHQFEWAWLLLRCQRWLRQPLLQPALRLIAVGEEYGVFGDFAINALRDDRTVHDASARLWPQCERLKATLLAATMTGEPHYWISAQSAASAIGLFLTTRVPGLWFDVRLPGGELGGDAVPASTLYHLVGAIAALNLAARAWP